MSTPPDPHDGAKLAAEVLAGVRGTGGAHSDGHGDGHRRGGGSGGAGPT